jgi:hypothetical protein
MYLGWFLINNKRYIDASGVNMLRKHPPSFFHPHNRRADIGRCLIGEIMKKGKKCEEKGRKRIKENGSKKPN